MNKRNKDLFKDWFEILRPFSWTASIIPIGLGAVLAYRDGYFTWIRFLPLLFGVTLLQGGANIANEYFDLLSGVDRPDKQRASMVLVEKRIEPEVALRASWIIIAIFLMGAIIYTAILQLSGLLLFALLAIFGSYYYTAPPFQLKYRGLGLLSVFLFFGLILPQAIYYTFSGKILLELVWFSLPVALLISAILYGNDLRDLQSEDDICTIASILGLERGFYLYVLLNIFPYLIVISTILTGLTSLWGLLVFVTLPLAIKNILQGASGIRGNVKELVKLDQKTAVLHLFFGLLWIITNF